MERTLYLNESGSNISVMRDGPSLWIKEKGSSGRRIPVRLIDLVVLVQNVKIDANSIALLSDNRIPLVIIDRRGEKKAYVLPYERKVPTRYKDQKFILRYEHNLERYRKWAETKKIIIAVSAIRKLYRDQAFTYREIGEGNYEIIIKELRQNFGIEDEKWKIVRTFVSSLFEGLILQKLLASGFDIHMGVLNRRKNLGLVLDVSYIMGGEIDLQTFQFFKSENKGQILFERIFGKWEIRPFAVKAIAHRFENRKREISSMIENVIDEMCELIREMRI